MGGTGLSGLSRSVRRRRRRAQPCRRRCRSAAGYADAGGQLERLVPVDAFEVDHLQALANSEVDGLAGGFEQVLQEGAGPSRADRVGAGPASRVRTASDRAGTAARALQPPQPDEIRRQPVHRRLGEARAWPLGLCATSRSGSTPAASRSSIRRRSPCPHWAGTCCPGAEVRPPRYGRRRGRGEPGRDGPSQAGRSAGGPPRGRPASAPRSRLTRPAGITARSRCTRRPALPPPSPPPAGAYRHPGGRAGRRERSGCRRP